MNKEKALERLLAAEKEIAECRKIIDAPQDIKDIVKDVDSAMSYLGSNDEEVELYHKMKRSDMPSHILTEQRCVIFCRALNERKPLNSTTYTPWFDKTKKPGSGFFNSCNTWGHDCGGFVSSRLHFNLRDHALYAGKVLEQEYYTYLITK